MPATIRIAWLCKARYMQHDVINDRYARLFELPQCLRDDVDVRAVCLDYRLSGSGPVAEDLAGYWHRFNLPRSLMIGWLFRLVPLMRSFRPHCIVASSDCLQVILGAWLAGMTGARFVADLYDDYSTFGLARIPGVKWLYRRALVRADGISVVSRTLGEDIQAQYPDKPVLVLESTIDAATFRPVDRGESRRALGLQGLEGKQLVGMCGGLNAFHGADKVFEALPHIAELVGDVQFIAAGKESPDLPLPQRDDLTFLGMLPHRQMPEFFAAMDVVIIPLSNTRFGYYAFPQKAYEVLACRVAAVAADVGALGMLFEGLPEVRYDPDSAEDLAEKVVWQLGNQRVLDVKIPTWGDQAGTLLGFVEGIVGDDQ